MADYNILSSWSMLAPVLSKMVNGIGYALRYQGYGVYANWKEKIISISPHSVKEDMEGSFRGFVFHELSHVFFHFTQVNFDTINKDKPKEEKAGRQTILNAILDPHGEELMKIYFLGSTEYLNHIKNKAYENFQELLTKNHVKIPGAAPEAPPEESSEESTEKKYAKIDHVFLALCSMMYKAQCGNLPQFDFSKTDPEFVGYYNKVINTIHDKFLEILPIIAEDRQVIFNSWNQKFNISDNTNKLIQIANDVYDLLKDNKEELKVPEQKSGEGEGEGQEGEDGKEGGEGGEKESKRKGKGKGKKSEKEGNGDSNGNGEGEEGEDKEGKGKGEKEGKEGKEKGKGKSKKVILVSGDRNEIEKEKLEAEIIYVIQHGEGYAKDPSNDVIEICKASNIEEYRKIKNSIPPHLNILKTHLRQLLLGRMRIREIGNQYEGVDSDLDFGALTDIHLKKENVWINKYNITTVKNTAVHLLLDASGSMSGSKEEIVRQLAVLFGECLDGLCKFKISSFTTHYGRSSGENVRSEPLWIKIYKDWSHKYVMSRASLTEYQATGNNVDGECVEWACRDLLMRPEQKKVLFVFSDGMPNCSYDQAKLQTHLRNVIEHYGKLVTIVGIGILSDSVEHFYPKFINVKKLESLGDDFFMKMKEVLA